MFSARDVTGDSGSERFDSVVDGTARRLTPTGYVQKRVDLDGVGFGKAVVKSG